MYAIPIIYSVTLSILVINVSISYNKYKKNIDKFYETHHSEILNVYVSRKFRSHY